MKRIGVAKTIAFVVLTCGLSATNVLGVEPSSAGITDPAAILRVGPPFALVAMEPKAEAEIRAAAKESSAGLSTAATLGLRDLWRDGSSIGTVAVTAFAPGALNESAYEAAVAAGAANAAIVLTTHDAAGVQVQTGSSGRRGLGIFRLGDSIVQVLTTADAARPATTALALASVNGGDGVDGATQTQPPDDHVTYARELGQLFGLLFVGLIALCIVWGVRRGRRPVRREWPDSSYREVRDHDDAVSWKRAAHDEAFQTENRELNAIYRVAEGSPE